MNRRDFIQAASVSALASTPLARAAAPAVKPIRLGIIGAGSRGQEDLRHFLRVPGVSLSAICDIYPPRAQQVNRIAGRTIPCTASYAEMLARTDIDAVLIASPVSCHAEHVIAAARSGRAIYGEKALGFTVEDNHKIVDEITRSKVLFQIGHEYRYAAWVQEAMRRVLAGEIGRPTHVYAYWHRNGNWRRSVPTPDPGKKLEHLINWRLYRETSGGLGTELGSHHIDMANWVFGEQPASVLGTQSICTYNDGRTVGDNVQLVFNYSEGRRLVFSSITDNAKTGCELWIYGTQGSVQITIEDATFFYEKSKPPITPHPTTPTARPSSNAASSPEPPTPPQARCPIAAPARKSKPTTPKTLLSAPSAPSLKQFAANTRSTPMFTSASAQPSPALSHTTRSLQNHACPYPH